MPGASFAGQQETFLNENREGLLEAVEKCWSSLFTKRAITYREEKGFRHQDVLISVAVQLMVEPKSAGVMFTLHPATGDNTKIMIEANWGLGEAVVSGAVTPDTYVVNKSNLEIVEKHIVTKKLEYALNPSTEKTEHLEIPPERQNIPALTDEEIKRIAQYGKQIEKHYKTAQDIEWAVDQKGEIYLLQSRPETVHGSSTGPAKKNTKTNQPETTTEREMILKGLGVSPGIGAGPVRVIKDINHIGELKEGDILVTRMTTPDWVPVMKKAAAIVTDEGGYTCHAAIVSRELGIPCVVGTKKATNVLQSERQITVDGGKGLIYRGILKAEKEEETVAAPVGTTTASTATKIYVNLSMPEIAERVAKQTQADGVGLLRAEHLMITLGKHPRKLIEEGGEQEMIDQFADGVRKVADAFSPGPVVYRFLDFKPDEFLALEGGRKYEEETGHVGPNPMIGYRGQFRYIKEPDVFRLECRAIKKVREEFGLRNLWVMLPFVQSVDVFRKVKQIMKEEGLDPGVDPDFQIWIMVEVPSCVLLIDKFCQEGINGVSFGTNDLTMLILGVDRNDASVQEIYDERNLAVLRAIAFTIKICKKYGVTTSICGQAPSVYPDYLEFLVRLGANSISVNPDTVLFSRRMVDKIERKLLLENVTGPSRIRVGKSFMDDVEFWKLIED
ncbi:MAG: phosphoenolpyruvate synthase [Candidatus Freyarchaeum deiterrae]